MTTSDASTQTEHAKVGHDGTRRFFARHPGMVKFGRLGWVAKGGVYLLVGFLAVALGLGWRQGSSDPTDEASQTGAVASIAEASYGVFLLIVVGAGLLLYAGWRLVTAVLPADNDVTAWTSRVGYGVSSVVYVLLAWTAWSYARGGGASDASAEGTEDAKVERFTRDLMSHTGGRWLVALVAIVMLAVGIYFAARGLKRHFDDQLIERGVGPLSYDQIVVLGRIGWTGRAAIFVLIGFFLTQAAWRVDPQEAQGFDGTLRKTLESPGGTAIVLFVGVALAIYGSYCVITAPIRRLAAADE